MAALIYLNLYFALSEPDNPIFAHNFILFVPSGLKSSIIPSLRDMQNFNPTWILPDPVASQLKNLIQYEWLQETSSASKSNIVKNPNARKISMHIANPDLMGLVAVTNAEKVILDRIDKETNLDNSLLKSLSEEVRKEYEAIKQANELREQIGKIPGLCILIDEVHHASDDQKLRQVVNKWMQQSNFNSVLGFSGTPNMDPPARIQISEALSIKCTQYSNVVTYYPLINGIGNFLKIPKVRFANLDSSEIIGKGLKEFFETYATTTYPDGTSAKIAVYAPSINLLEEEIFPEACNICAELGINSSEAILKYHKGNKDYSVAEDAQFEFSQLDSPLSKKRIILLVGIGREGWNCKSLTGVILSQRNSCPQNMVLQISCRCLREVDDARKETALIWLNKFNADKLNQQLQEQQYTTIHEFGGKTPDNLVTIYRHSRMEKLKLPPIDFYQVHINYKTIETEKAADITTYLNRYQIPAKVAAVIYTQGFDMDNHLSESASLYGVAEACTFREWIDSIIKEGLGTLRLSEIMKYENNLRNLFEKITLTTDDGSKIFNPHVDQRKVRADIRRALVPKRSFSVTEELVPEEASLLKINALRSPIEVSSDSIYAPSQAKVAEIVRKDREPLKTISDEVRQYLIENNLPLPETEQSINDRTYHYLPYHLDSTLEDDYLNSVINHLKSEPGIEFYFNGDDTLTDFKIRCYSRRGRTWKMLGYYFPDFIMLTRNEDNSINKLVIVETKGEGFAAKFQPRKRFMEEMFIRLNNERYGRDRFSFLYIEDTMPCEVRLLKTISVINSFLKN
ncbi:MAG: DEAD/DEAH box helicase family protein [Muribaculaceae bacterium]|nr:DEAD/DEAH box helicase family protein [Muribaculaceae bacterium]